MPNADYWIERQKTPLPFKPKQLFTEEELKAKSKRYKEEMIRAKEGKQRKYDTIPSDEWKVRGLIIKLFYPADAWVLCSFLFPEKKGFGLV
jgi:hypothetical protein